YASLGNIWGGYIALVNVKSQNKFLRDKLHEVGAENSKLREIAVENANLKKVLRVIGDSGITGVVANVIGYNASQWTQVITVDRGLEDGVKEGMAVIFGEGVVGQVFSVALGSSRVLLITDHSSGVDALIQRSRARGVVRGSGGRACDLQYVPIEEEVLLNDRIVTSGMDGVYPKGFIIGFVSAIEKSSDTMFHAIKMKPEVNFSKIETVFIIILSANQNPEF
ncbi:rod shape-determining protein MreC, partial [Oligoflexia bacterium]|nr:rod shape-determining protein MreC [Oligoflexia bacterium]